MSFFQGQQSLWWAMSRHWRNRIPVVLYEGHPLVTRYILPILRSAHDISVSLRRVYTDFDNVGREPHSILLIDTESIRLPITRHLHDLRVKLPMSQTIVLGGSISVDELCRLLFSGVEGFVKYDGIEGQLISAIRNVFQGHLAFPPIVLERFAQQASKLSNWRVGRGNLLSPREQSALSFLQQGMSNKEISTSLGISERTVKFHLSNIFLKLGVHDRSKVAELMRSGDMPKCDGVSMLYHDLGACAIHIRAKTVKQ